MKQGLVILGLSGLVACSSGIKKADISESANPADEISRLEGEIKEGYTKQLDVLAKEDFEKSQSYLKEAKEDLADQQKQSEILEDVAYGQAFLNRANQLAGTRATKVQGLINVREQAVLAGARNFPSTKEELGRLDKELRGYAEEPDRISADRFDRLQTKYLGLELDSIEKTQLGKAQAQINAAEDHRAANYTPVALRRAEMDYTNARNMISTNRNRVDSYASAVAKANQSAGLLTDILAATRGGERDEATATRIVLQDRKISNLQGELQTAGNESKELGSALQKASKVANLQESLEQARKEFSQDEAEVYQQGDKLVIRLKSMNFPSGRSEVPAQSMPLLEKVRAVAADLGPKKVVVEGHTDSVGNEQVNSILSEQRAKAIAQYLETNGISEDKIEAKGFGFAKPIASNKSKDGRAQNRRVDVIITPQ